MRRCLNLSPTTPVVHVTPDIPTTIDDLAIQKRYLE